MRIKYLVRIVETGEIFKTQQELAERLNTSSSAVNNALRDRTKTLYGYHLEYVDVVSQSEENRKFDEYSNT